MKSSKLIIFYYNDIFAIIYYFERNDRIQKKKDTILHCLISFIVQRLFDFLNSSKER